MSNCRSRAEGAARVFGEGVKVVAVRADFSDVADPHATSLETVEAMASVDILVNNAGLGALAGSRRHHARAFRSPFDLNLLGLLFVEGKL